MNKIFTALICILAIILLTAAEPAVAQNDRQYHIANQLLQQQKYEQAFRLFNELHKKNPGNYTFLQKSTECLVNMKRYDEAIAITDEAVNSNRYNGQASVRLGEIFHIRGDTTRAYKIWENTLDRQNRFQTYLQVARTMSDRREFERAVTVYEQARRKFSSSTLLSTELANTYMQAGQYEKAVREFLVLVREEPQRIDYVQRSLIRYGDEYLHDTAILEIEEFLGDLSLDHPAHRRLHQLHIWLLLERNLYRRAVATAREYEQRTSEVTYSLLGLGNKLLSERKYDLAEETYRYYIDNNIVPAKYQSMEELSRVYVEWADYLSDYNLAYAQRRDSLYQQAFDVLNRLREEAPYYDQMGKVLLRQAELAIDYLHDVELASRFLNMLRSRRNSASEAQQFYVEGRIKLYEEDYARARIAFTKSNKQEKIGALAEKTRYYLALTDFYAGDYEYAKIQLNALEKQTTSYYANDAVQLRIWIQKGLGADSTGSVIAPFAEGVEQFNQGNDRKAVNALSPIISVQAYHPLMDEALLELSRHITPDLTSITYSAINNYLERWGQTSALRERLMWEQARIADQVVSNDLELNFQQESGGNRNLAEQFFDPQFTMRALPGTAQQVRKLYEDILLEFPSGFYASFARERIQELNKPQI
ncbi:MAG: tetratricopeptide repeat protein [Balneolaceae bacterium]|nr:tetratricopeptide repeat protein [Balneolaceae bacterium]